MIIFEEGDVSIVLYSENYYEINYNIDNKLFKFLVPLEDKNMVVT